MANLFDKALEVGITNKGEKVNFNDFITMPLQSGFSEPLTVGGRKGKFDFNVPPTFNPNVGGGKSPLFKFITDTGEAFDFRIEKNKQGGRWEEGQDAPHEFELMKSNPQIIIQMWGDTSIARMLNEGILRGMTFEQIQPLLKKFNTHRQISGD